MFPRHLLSVVCLLLLPLAARAADFSGKIGDGEALFLPEGLSPDTLPPSFALVKPPKVRGPLPEKWTLRPVFSHPAEGKMRATLAVPPETSLYGEGEVVGPLLRNGTRTILWNTDNGAYDSHDGGRRLYQSHPWVMGVRPDGTAFGFLADTTWRAEINLKDGIEFTSDGPAFPVIVVERSSPQELMHALAGLIGTAPLPPRWALGYHQCRYSYEPDARVREIADTFRAKQIPCDVIWMDIDYMDGFRIFTFDPKKFPDPKATNDYLHAHNFHSVWMIDPGVKAEPGYKTYDSGARADVWIKAADGKEPYRGKVWPGDCVFPDFTRPETRAWWAAQYRDFMAKGVDGVWNDMNEPALFDRADPTMDNAARARGGDPSWADAPAEYSLPPEFWFPRGAVRPGPMAQYHNVFGMMEVSASRAGIQQANPDKRPFVLSRSGFLGSQRYGATWTGDNVSKWEHLKVSIPMTLSLGLAGQPFSGPDMGGFQGKGTPELWANWIAVGAFFPFCRGHSDKGTPNKEPWAYGEETEKAARTALQRRYRLLPYLYTLFKEHIRYGLPVMRPVFFADPKDKDLRAEEQAFLLGGDLLVIPRWAEKPALPKGIWRAVSLLEGDAEKDKYQPEVRVRGGAIVPLGKVIQSTAEESLDPLTLLVCPDKDGKAAGELYDDAGDGYGYRGSERLDVSFTARREGDEAVIEVMPYDYNVVGLRLDDNDGDGHLAKVGQTPAKEWQSPLHRVQVQILTDDGVKRGEGEAPGVIRVKLAK